MVIEFTLLGTPMYIEQPQELVGLAGWFLLLSTVIFLLFQWRQLNKRRTRITWGIFIGLTVLLVLTNLFIIVGFPAGATLPIQGLPDGAEVSALVLFAALPWVLAAGLLGVLPAAILGMLSGLMISLLYTHSLFTALEYSLMAVLLGAAFHQRYRTWVFRALRHPVFSTILMAFIYPLFFILDTTLIASGTLADRL